MPSLRDQVRDWQQGVEAVARGDWGCALRLFSSVREPPAKMCFNVGCVHLLAGDPGAALRAFDQAVAKDPYLAVGFFQQGVATFQLERFQEALSGFQRALAQLRGNACIDYTQLGLRFRLRAWEVLFSVAAAQCRLGLWAEAARSLEEAMSKGPGATHGDLNSALARVQRRVPLQPRSVPRGEVFRPPRWQLQRLEPVDFLGEAKVVAASAVPDNPRDSVWPQRPQVPHGDGGAQPGPGPRARLRPSCQEGGVSPEKGAPPRRTPSPAPGAALEVGSGQAGRADPCIPATCAEQRPHEEQAGTQVALGPPAAAGTGAEPSAGAADAEGAAGGDPESLVTVTVQCAFTLALDAPRGAELSLLRALLSRALPHQAQRGQLSYREPGDSGPWVPLPAEDGLRRAWQGVASGPLRLRCQAAGSRPVLYQAVARHSYSAQGPEDLALRRGDTVDVLCEVDQAWLEGHHDGRIGIFPKCFVVPASQSP